MSSSPPAHQGRSWLDVHDRACGDGVQGGRPVSPILARNCSTFLTCLICSPWMDTFRLMQACNHHI
jgi:hypothetical protein